MKKYLSKKTILILSTITLFTVLISLYFRPIKPLPKVISTSPTSNSTKVNYFDSLKLKFDQPVNPGQISITSIPEESWEITTSPDDPTIVKLNHKQYFHVDTDYTLTVFYDHTQIYLLKFKTLPQQSDPRYVQEVNNTMARDYPLATKVPYENNVFKIVYSAPLTLSITIINSNMTSQEVIDEVKAWVTKNGGDASAHKFVVVPYSKQ